MQLEYTTPNIHSQIPVHNKFYYQPLLNTQRTVVMNSKQLHKVYVMLYDWITMSIITSPKIQKR